MLSSLASTWYSEKLGAGGARMVGKNAEPRAHRKAPPITAIGHIFVRNNAMLLVDCAE